MNQRNPPIYITNKYLNRLSSITIDSQIFPWNTYVPTGFVCLACQSTPTSLVSVVFVSVLSSEYSRQLVVSFSYVTTSLACTADVQLFSCLFTLHIEDCDAWWFSGGCSSLVVVEARSSRFNSQGVTAGFWILLCNIINELHSVRENWVHGR